jgi:uncharacterized protein YndB with AHSA1/START domain
VGTVTTTVRAAPGEVFAVLADGWYYPTWVVGTSHVRAVGADWPASGSRLFHCSGVWPVALRDETRVEAVVPDRRLVLLAQGRPMGEARVTIDLTADGRDTRVSLGEEPVSGPGRWLHNPVAEALLVRRNVESLARLAALAERRDRP